MKKVKLSKTLWAIRLICQFAFMAYLLNKLFIFLCPSQSWQAVVGFIILIDIILSNALLIFRNNL